MKFYHKNSGKKTLFLVISVAAGLLVCAGVPACADTADQAEDLLKQAKIVPALALLDRDALSFKEQLIKARALYLNQQFSEAMFASQSLLSHGRERLGDDIYARAHLMLAASRAMIVHHGSYWTKLVNGRRILPHLKEAESVLPDDAEVSLGLGSFYLFSPKLIGGDLKKAGVYLTLAADRSSGFADVLVRLAQYHQRKGDGEEFDRYLKQALAMEPNNILANDILSGQCRFICIEDITP